jgi:hypothetical protein
LTKSIAEAFIPEIVWAKYQRAQMLYFLAWLYPDLIKVGELVGLTALELTLRDRYGNTVKARGKSGPTQEPVGARRPVALRRLA